MLSIGYECTTDCIDLAAAKEHLGIILYLHNRKERCTARAIINAAKGGYLDAVKFSHYNLMTDVLLTL
jgi:hypothetical protein